MFQNQRGFSLLELMVTITVLAILLAIAVPSFRDLIHRSQVSSASNDVLSSVAYARTEAINRGQQVSMCASTTGDACSGSAAYDTGWIVYTYPAGAASANKAYAAATSILLRATTARSGVSVISNNASVITFGQQGQLKPSTPTLKFATCWRSGDTGEGTITDKVPGAELNINGSGSATALEAAACTPI